MRGCMCMREREIKEERTKIFNDLKISETPLPLRLPLLRRSVAALGSTTC